MTDLMYSTEMIVPDDNVIMERAKAFIESDPVLDVMYGFDRITRTRIYERLRKRSHRAYLNWDKGAEEHEAYLEGVRETLLAIRNA